MEKYVQSVVYMCMCIDQTAQSYNQHCVFVLYFDLGLRCKERMTVKVEGGEQAKGRLVFE